MAASKILIVDDEPNIRRVLRAMLSRQGYDVLAAADGMEATALLEQQDIDLVITDLRMEGMDGMGLLRHAQDKHPELPVVMITAHGTVDTAVEAMKLGAFDFVTKPFEQEELTGIVAKALRSAELGQTRPRAANVEQSHGAFGMIGRSAAMTSVFDMIRKVANSPSTVLITGESGTGKELVARAMHEHSSRHKQPFIKINCAAIPDTLVESELFGYEKGAFTGATSSKPGRFELADGGTLFLDEVGEIPLETQVKLLRFLQDAEFERVGGVRSQRVDVRLVTATNRDLSQAIEESHFREDLFYRLNVVPIHLPPLRDRREDIPLLAMHSLEYFKSKLAKQISEIPEETMSYLVSYRWPGNIRELENVLERCLLFCEGERILPSDLPVELRQSTVGTSTTSVSEPQKSRSGGLKDAVREATTRIERESIIKALESTDGNVTKAAKALQISRKSLQNKMRDLGLRELPGDRKS